MFAKGQTVIQIFEQFAPQKLAVAEDRIGLQVGTLNKEIKSVLVALDVTEEVVDEAIGKRADLIIAHHAVIYKPLKHLRTDTSAGKIYEKCIKHDISVYIAHTNLDVAEGGINDMMADALGLEQTSHLQEVYREDLLKLVVFVPEDHLEQVSQAVFSAGAGYIGDYSHCSFQLAGEGTFLPHEGTNPFIGKPGKLEKVKEIRLETIVPGSLRNRVVQAMLKAHPYEEPAYDLYPLQLEGKSYGLGRVGTLKEQITLKEMAERVKQAFDVSSLRIVGDLDRPVQKVAVLGGSGSRFVSAARCSGADVFITGDIDYHTALDALADGMALIDPGHNAEKIMKKRVAEYLRAELAAKRYDTRVSASEVDTDPFRFM